MFNGGVDNEELTAIISTAMNINNDTVALYLDINTEPINIMVTTLIDMLKLSEEHVTLDYLPDRWVDMVLYLKKLNKRIKL